MEKVKFIHASDLHLGAPLKVDAGDDRRLREFVDHGTYRACEQIVDRAIAEAVDFVLLSGDIYDRESRSVRANRFLIEQFERLRAEDIYAYLIYGNHDPMDRGHEFFEFPSNVVRFSAAEVEELVVKKEGEEVARILGQSYGSRHESQPLFENFTPSEPSLPCLALLHTSLERDSNRYVPCSPTDLREMKQIDYWALGHRHFLEVFDGEPLIAYPGVSQGLTPLETGVAGCLLVEVEGNKSPRLTFLPTGRVIWLQKTINLGETEEPLQNIGDLQDLLAGETEKIIAQEFEELLHERAVSEGISYKNGDFEPAGYAVRWQLRGRCELHQQLQEQKAELREEIGAYLQREYAGGSPFVLPESIEINTARHLPEIDELIEEDEVYAELEEIVSQLLENEEAHCELADVCGSRWKYTKEAEDLSADQFQLSSELLQQFILRARDRVVDELYGEST